MKQINTGHLLKLTGQKSCCSSASTHRPPFGLMLPLLFCTSCFDTSQDYAKVALYVSGTAVQSPLPLEGGEELTMSRADLAFGPLYLCAGKTAGDLCDTARLEWLDSVIVNTLDATPKKVGDLTGVTGTVLSWMYDLGISSQLTQGDPIPLQSAQELNNSSFSLAGTVTYQGISLPFRVEVPIQQNENTELGVPVVRKGSSDRFEYDVTSQGETLTIKFDPRVLTKNLNFRPYFTSAECEPDGPDIVCDGTKEYRCGEDGQITEETDCSEFDQVCLPNDGCATELVIEQDSSNYRGLRNALLSGTRPEFLWASPEGSD